MSALRSARARRAVSITRVAFPCTSRTSRSSCASAILNDCCFTTQRRLPVLFLLAFVPAFFTARVMRWTTLLAFWMRLDARDGGADLPFAGAPPDLPAADFAGAD